MVVDTSTEQQIPWGEVDNHACRIARSLNLEVVAEIGRGSYGAVYLVFNQVDQSFRALKVVPLETTGSGLGRGRELHAVQLLEQWQSTVHDGARHIVRINYVNESGGILYYLMEAADDTKGARPRLGLPYSPATMATLIGNGQLSVDEVWSYTRDLLNGLSSLHAMDLIHRDIKPSNILFVDGRVKIADLGIVSKCNRDVSLVGTVDYMPPDSRMGKSADTWAVGLIIYQMLTGNATSQFPSTADCSYLSSTQGQALNRVMLRACDPHRRYSDAATMLDDLEKPAHGRQRRTVFALGLASVCVLIALVVGLMAYLPNSIAADRTASVDFISHPFEATITLNGKLLLQTSGEPYRTPCTVDNIDVGSHRIEYHLSGRPSLVVGERQVNDDMTIEAAWDE